MRRTLDPRAGGCFCERWENGRQSVEHLHVVQARPPVLIRLVGGLGPLQALPVSGVLDVRFEPVEPNGSRLLWSYTVRGADPVVWEEPVSGVLAAQMASFAAHADRR